MGTAPEVWTRLQVVEPSLGPAPPGSSEGGGQARPGPQPVMPGGLGPSAPWKPSPPPPPRNQRPQIRLSPLPAPTRVRPPRPARGRQTPGSAAPLPPGSSLFSRVSFSPFPKPPFTFPPSATAAHAFLPHSSAQPAACPSDIGSQNPGGPRSSPCRPRSGLATPALAWNSPPVASTAPSCPADLALTLP